MIELRLCGPLSASITQKQCDINRETVGACRTCLGLGAVVERRTIWRCCVGWSGW